MFFSYPKILSFDDGQIFLNRCCPLFAVFAYERKINAEIFVYRIKTLHFHKKCVIIKKIGKRKYID